MKSSPLVVLITGCSSGIGEALCHAFHKQNCTVIATARSLDSLGKLQNKGLEVKQLDINNRTEIDRVVAAILERMCLHLLMSIP